MKENRKELYNEIKNKIIEISEKYRKKEDVDKFKNSIEEKLENFKPSMMIYGVYNAGKSTLLNAIFGKEVASVSDAPETDKVKGYEYNGYTIYDTPGINAPIEHEKITQNHLKKSELIIFVLSNDGSFEEVYIYEKISEIIKANKPLLLVMNNKAGIKVNSIEEKEIYSKIEKNLRKMAKIQEINEIEKKIDICLVDAKKAFKAKSESKKLLLKNSNILELEKKIKEMLKESSSENVINTLKDYIRNYIEETITILENNISDEEGKEIESIISSVNRLKKSTFFKSKNLIELKSESLQNEIIHNLIINNTDKIETIVKVTTKDIENSINREIEYSYKKLKEKLENKIIKKLNLKYEKEIPSSLIEVQLPEIANEKEKKGLDDVLLEFPLSNIPINIPVTILKILFNVFSKNNNQKEKALMELEAKKNQYMFVQSKVKSFIFDYKNELIRNLDDFCNEVFNNTIEKIREKKEKQENQSKELIKDKEKLEKFIL